MVMRLHIRKPAAMVHRGGEVKIAASRKEGCAPTMPGMIKSRIWRGVRMRDTESGTDPDAPTRTLTLPAAWDDRAAAALAALAPGEGQASLPRAAEAWIRPVAARARAAGDEGLADRLHGLLLRRRAAPTAAVWNGAAGRAPGYVLNLPAFHCAATGFDTDAFAEAVTTAATALRLSDPAAQHFAIGVTDLDGLLAILGLDYASTAARDVAACVAALLRATADVALAGGQPDLLALPNWPEPPRCHAAPDLLAAVRRARRAALRGACAVPCTAILPPGPADALLGAETGGIAPAFSAVSEDGRLTRAAEARLAARGMTPAAALAAHLSGRPVLLPAGLEAHQAMHDAVAPYLHAMPPRPVAQPAFPLAPPHRRELPARRRGYTQKASVGGHRLYLRTGEYADGTLGEIEVSLPREGVALRRMMDALTAAVSLGLQHGVPLSDYVAAFTLTQFRPAGAVEGDPDVAQATSILDYVFRNLATHYLGGCDVPEAAAPEPAGPWLPLDLPAAPRVRRAALRVVSAR